MDFSVIANYIPALSADWLIVGGLVLFLTFDAFRAGPSRVIALCIALPIALMLSTDIENAALLGSFVSNAAPAIQTGVFIALTVALFVALNRIVDFGADSMHPVAALIAGVAGAAICMVVLLQIPDTTLPWTFGHTCSQLFGEAYRLYWMVAAYFALAISRG